MCVCVCVCVCAVAQLVRVRRVRLENGNIQDLASSSHSDGEVWHNFLGQKLTHNCLSRLRSINEYLVIDWCGKGFRLRQSPSATGVRVGLRVPKPQLASHLARLQEIA